MRGTRAASQASRRALRAARGLSRQVRSRVSTAVSRQRDRARTESQPLEVAQSAPAMATPRREPHVEARQLRRARRDAKALLESLTLEGDRLRAERLEAQQALGAVHGEQFWPLMKVEKTNGTASFVAAQRMMQRVYRRAADPQAGIDGVGAEIGPRNPEGAARFARSHGVPVVLDLPDDSAQEAARIVVHAFKGKVGLVEIRDADGVRHFDADGEDPGDIRPAATYVPDLPRPEAFDDVVRWSARLSRRVPRPYVQLTFAVVDGSAAVDRIDVDPDRLPVLTPEWDERLGSVFDYAYSRFLLQPYRAGGLANRVPGGIFSYQDQP